MFEGIYIALVTPFRASGEVDHDSLAALCDNLIGRGVHGLVPAGTTGEAATLTHDEHIATIETVVRAANGRVPVIAGTGSNSTQEAIELTLAAKNLGASGALLISPYYVKPTQEGLYRHFEAIAAATTFPLVLYNIPSRTAVSFSADTIARLARLPEVVGIKEASGDITFATEVMLRVSRDFTLTAGDDAMLLPMLALGAQGVISVAAQVVPEKMLALWTAWQSGDVKQARDIHDRLFPLIKAMFVETNPAPVKEALHMIGAIAQPDLRLPLVRIQSTSRAIVRDALAAQGLLPQH